MPHKHRAWLWTAITALSAATSTGCVDKEKCDEALRVTRDALAKEQPDLARQWRERAWKICDDSTVTSPLDQEIVNKEAELSKRAADLAKQVADAAQKRMTTASQVWHGFDAEDEKDRTAARLDVYKAKADRMTDGLPPEYAQQIQTYNSAEYEKRKQAIQAAAKKP